jgi:phosphatidylglycerophosphatase C
MTSHIVAIFDFDHTLTTWDTAARFFSWLLRRSPWRMVVLLVAAPFIGPFLLVRRTRKIPIRFTVWLATFGVSEDDLAALAKQHVQSVLDAGEAFLLQQARSRVAHHQAAGHHVVIATGALEVLVREILCAEQVHDVTVVGSSLRPHLGGMVTNQHCYGLKKIPMLTQRGFAPPWAFVYTDHRDDLPILELGHERFIINPLPKCAAHLQAALGTSATYLSWR